MNKRLSLFLLIISVGLLTALAAGPVFGAAGGASPAKGPPEHLREQARPVFEIEGVVYTDATDDGFLEIGVTNKGLARAVEERLKKLDVPLSSVRIVETQPIVFARDLQDQAPSLEGGLQIQFVDGAFAYSCTVGFNAVRAGVDGFVTNSHCTADQFALDGTDHYQSSWNTPSHMVGSEIADPASFKCNVKGKKCRNSDAAFDKLANGVSAPLGSIAKTNAPNNDSLDIVGNFNITSEAGGNTAKGITLNKVGRTTGWTQGLVTRSCVDTGVQGGGNILLLCQDFVGAKVIAGDSGSPVFRITGGTNVELSGILWGGASDGSYFVYSPISNIEQDMGSLTTHGTATTGSISGTVTADVDGAAISGATVETDTGQSDTTDSEGNYNLVGVPTGNRTVEVQASGYQGELKAGQVLDGQNTIVDFALTETPPPIPPGSGSISGTVTADVGGAGISGATVETDTGQSDTTDSAGNYNITDVPTGDRTVEVQASGYQGEMVVGQVLDGENAIVDFALTVDGGGSGIVAHVEDTNPFTVGKKKELRLTHLIWDGAGNPVVGASITLQLTRPDGTVLGATVTTNDNGEATVRLRQKAKDGIYMSTVSAISGDNITFEQCTDADNSMDHSTVEFEISGGVIMLPVSPMDECAAS